MIKKSPHNKRYFDSLKLSNDEYTNMILKLINEILEYIITNPQEISDKNIIVFFK